MGLQDRDYVRKGRSSNAIDEYERSAREAEYGKRPGPGPFVKVVAAILVILMIIAFVGRCS